MVSEFPTGEILCCLFRAVFLNFKQIVPFGIPHVCLISSRLSCEMFRKFASFQAGCSVIHSASIARFQADYSMKRSASLSDFKQIVLQYIPQVRPISSELFYETFRKSA